MLKDVGVAFSHELGEAPAPRRAPTLVCFSHLRWDFVFQRPQHLMSRFAASHNVQCLGRADLSSPRRAAPRVEARTIAPNLTDRHAAPSRGHDRGSSAKRRSARLLDDYLGTDQPEVAWYYTPMMLPFSRHLRGRLHRL